MLSPWTLLLTEDARRQACVHIAAAVVIAGRPNTAFDGVDSPLSIQHIMVDAITAATMAAVDLHLAHLGLYPRSEPASSHDIVNPNRPRATSASVATLPPLTGSVVPTTHPSATLPNSALSLLNPESPRMTLAAHIRDMETKSAVGAVAALTADPR